MSYLSPRIGLPSLQRKPHVESYEERMAYFDKATSIAETIFTNAPDDALDIEDRRFTKSTATVPIEKGSNMMVIAERVDRRVYWLTRCLRMIEDPSADQLMSYSVQRLNQQTGRVTLAVICPGFEVMDHRGGTYDHMSQINYDMGAVNDLKLIANELEISLPEASKE